MPMLIRPTNMWLCALLCCAACVMDSSPRVPATTDTEARKKSAQGQWRPAEADDDEVRTSTGTKIAPDTAASADAAMPATAVKPTPPVSNTSNNALPMGQATPVDMTAPAAGSSVEPAPPMAAAGSGGVAGDQAGAAGSAGAGSDNLRQRFIDAAIDALGGSDGMEPWRTGGQAGGRLSADLVLGVLVSMRTSGVCFRDVRRCVETCVMISQDCKPCAEDAECAAALKEVCGETLGACRMP